MSFTKSQKITDEDLIGIVCRFYPDHVVEKVWDFKNHKYHEPASIKDSLAYSLVKQARSCFNQDPAVSLLHHLLNLKVDYQLSIADIQAVLDGLEEYCQVWVVLEFCQILKKQNRTLLSPVLFSNWLCVHDIPVFRDTPEKFLGCLKQVFPGLMEAEEIWITEQEINGAIEQLSVRLSRCPEAVPVVPPPAPVPNDQAPAAPSPPVLVSVVS